MTNLLLGTNNQNKVKEFNEIFKSLDIKLVTLKDININIDVEETGTTFEENALLKAKGIYESQTSLVKLPVIAEDTGLCIDALGGEPGVRSKRFYEDEGKTEHEGNLMIIDKLKDVPLKCRTARYITVLCFYDGTNTIIAEGRSEGFIANKEIGTNGFAYDPIFISSDYNKTFGELSDEEKNSVSHRKKGIMNLLEKVTHIINK